MMKEDILAAARDIGDALSLGVLIAWFLEVLPAIATLLTIFWTVIRICETDTFKRMREKARQAELDRALKRASDKDEPPKTST